MDQLKRWREERAIRQSLRLLKDFRDPDDPPPAATRRLHSLEPTTRLGRRAAKATGKKKFKLWPDPPRVSPVHPEWDDPTGDRFKKSMYKSMGVHFVIIPSLLLLSSIDLTKEQRFIPNGGRMQAVPITLVGPPGGGKLLEKPRQPTAPKTETPKPPPEKQSPPKTIDDKAMKVKPVAEKPQPKPAKPEPKTDGTIPKPVPDKQVAERERERRTTESAPPARSTSEPEPVTDPVASEGPLLAGRGPVAGSSASIGGIDGVDFPYNYYLETVRGKIAQTWQIPEGLVSKGRRLQAVVRFRIGRDGAIQESLIEEPSGFEFFDQAALRAVSQARKFPPLPQEFGGSHLVVHFQFTFVGR